MIEHMITTVMRSWELTTNRLGTFYSEFILKTDYSIMLMMLLVTYVSKTKNWCLAYYMYIVVEKFGHMKICLNVERASIHLVQVCTGPSGKNTGHIIKNSNSYGCLNTFAWSVEHHSNQPEVLQTYTVIEVVNIQIKRSERSLR